MVAGWIVAGWWLLRGAAPAQDAPPVAPPVATPETDSIDAVARDFDAALAKSNYHLKEAQAVALIDRYWKLQDASRGQPDEFPILKNLLVIPQYAEGAKVDDAWREAIEKLLAGHVDDPQLAGLVAHGFPPKRLAAEFDAFLAEVAETTGCLDVKAALAMRELRPLLDAEALGELHDDDQRAELIAKLAQIKTRFAAAVVPDENCSYAEFVDQTSWAIENLRPGKPALEIAGKDLDDSAFRLSEYRGKVVLLDFWGFW